MTPFSECSTTNFSAGTKSEHSVGIPTPRLAIQPSSNSSAIRCAMRSRVRRGLASVVISRYLDRAHRVPDAALRLRRYLHDALHPDSGRVDVVGFQRAGRHDLLDL